MNFIWLKRVEILEFTNKYLY